MVDLLTALTADGAFVRDKVVLDRKAAELVATGRYRQAKIRTTSHTVRVDLHIPQTATKSATYGDTELRTGWRDPSSERGNSTSSMCVCGHSLPAHALGKCGDRRITDTHEVPIGGLGEDDSFFVKVVLFTEPCDCAGFR
ncbi:hypothetical protein ACFWUP_12790 [Nocardia sp. NPDC058658]|uniref:hypothetical protein n=1 Tax=Nocardia sp. NPDC058658 TaxID=3346580 RepID=UPI003667CD70